MWICHVRCFRLSVLTVLIPFFKHIFWSDVMDISNHHDYDETDLDHDIILANMEEHEFFERKGEGGQGGQSEKEGCRLKFQSS